MKRQIAIVLISLIFLAGCSLPVFKGDIKPIYPKVGFSVEPPRVDSLTPTFRWQSNTKSPSTYDFAIWDIGEERRLESYDGFFSHYSYKSRPYIYYKEALPQPEHTIEIPLAPNTLYYWSVRIRSGDKVSEWASYDYHDWLVIGSIHGRNWPYPFRTPKTDKKKDEGVDTGQVK